MIESLDLISKGGGWSVTVIGMGAVFASLIILVVFIKVFAAILQRVQNRREAREEVVKAGAAPGTPPEPPTQAEVAPEVVAAAAMALAGRDRIEEVVAAVSYAIHHYVSDETSVSLPAAAAVARENGGGGASPWRMAGRVRLMNSRSRHMVRGRRV